MNFTTLLRNTSSSTRGCQTQEKTEAPHSSLDEERIPGSRGQNKFDLVQDKPDYLDHIIEMKTNNLSPRSYNILLWDFSHKFRDSFSTDQVLIHTAVLQTSIWTWRAVWDNCEIRKKTTIKLTGLTHFLWWRTDPLYWLVWTLVIAY